MRQFSLLDAPEIVAGDPTWMFETFVDPGRNLSGEPATPGENGRANDGRVTGVDQFLPAHQDVTAKTPGIVLRFEDAINISASHLPDFMLWASTLTSGQSSSDSGA